VPLAYALSALVMREPHTDAATYGRSSERCGSISRI